MVDPTKARASIDQPETALPAAAVSIFNDIFDFYGLLDRDGRVVALGGAIFTQTNTNPDLLHGQIFAETVFWQSSEMTSRLLDKAIDEAAAGEKGKILIDFRVSADERLPMEVVVHPTIEFGGDGTIFIAGRSVADQLGQADQRRTASEQLLFAAENAEIGLWFWDFDEDRIHATPRCNELFGLAGYKTFRYADYREAIFPEDREFVDAFLGTSRQNGSKYSEEFRVRYEDGSVEWILAEGRSFRDDSGRPLRMTGVVQKITERKVEADEIAKVHDRERKAREDAVEANRAKDFFLAFVSHELRSPLNAILGWSKILLTKDVEEPIRRNALETIERSARFQTKLINDLVDSARVASGKLRLEFRQTNLFDVVSNSLEAQKPSADAKNIELSFASSSNSIALFADSSRLQQVFGNLISNAIKFTPEGGKVGIEIKVLTDSVQVEVVDSGHGIHPNALPHIFKQFSQADVEQSRTNLGLGLGLSIVKILVTKHGGAVQAESEGVGKGSKFTVTLPLSEGPIIEERPPDLASIEKARPLEGTHILVVEDDMDSREVLELFLMQNGAAVASFDAVKPAFAHLTEAARLPDLIISDLGMPEEDGYSFIAKVRSLPEENGGKIPAIALSAFTSTESRDRALGLGFTRYNTKPFEHENLIRDVLDLLREPAA